MNKGRIVDSDFKRNNRFEGILREVKGLVVSECANYSRNGPFNTQHYCWKHEKRGKGICAYFHETQLSCPYFEKAVLPLDEELQESYHHKEENHGGKTQDRESDFGRGDVQIPGDIETVPAEAPKFRGSLDRHRGAGILPRPAFHGVVAQKQVAGQRRPKLMPE